MKRQKQRDKNAQAGFTLIEAMLAVTILGIGLVSLVECATRCIGVVKATKVYQDARELINRVELEEPLILEEEIGESSQSGRFTGRYSNYSWHRDVVLISEEEDGLYEVTTKIIWSDRGEDSFEEVVTLIYAPPEEDDDF